MSEIPKHNILFILTDQHLLSAIGAYGETPCKTPNIDTLAKEGILFKNAYTTNPVCSPARSSIMTGLYPHSNGMCNNIHDPGCSLNELTDSSTLLSRKLQGQGYQLGYSGKWHLGTDFVETPFGAPNNPILPKDLGFEGQNFSGHGGGGFYYTEYKDYRKKHGYSHELKPLDKSVHPVADGRELTGPVESTVPYFITENTIELIEKFRQKSEPFFIWHSFWGPHSPYYATKEFVDIYRDIKIPPWQNFDWASTEECGGHRVKVHGDHKQLDWNFYEHEIKHYYAFTSMIDAQIGRIIQHLKKTGELENTIIVFTSDHGETLGHHGKLSDKGFHHFEEIQRIPMIVRFPDKLNAGTRIKELVSLIDIYPTLLDMAGVSSKTDDIHGASLLPLIQNEKKTYWRDAIVVEFFGLGAVLLSLRTIRVGDLKLGFNFFCDDELYDLSKDPHEMNNLIHHPDYQDDVRRLRRRLLKWMEETNDPMKNTEITKMLLE